MVQVRVAEGLLEGEEVTNDLGGTFFSFKGIPYAQPPVGDLRFKAPQPPKPWDGVRSAKEHGSPCYQYDHFMQHTTMGAEDCLYLNVYSPNLNPIKPLPVMFWIHGGGFICGNSNDDLYGPEFLVRKDVILVSINYRLDIFGFLSLDTAEVPGNAGMKDQVAALRWVKRNISNFGGDPDNVTIFGESAGGASVAYHLISPMSKGLFKRAIAQSGVALNAWANDFEHYRRAIALARKLGFESEDANELYQFFKSQPCESLVNIKAPLTLAEKGADRIEIQLTIVSEKDFGQERFFIGEVIDVLRSGIHEGVEVIAGYCEHEGIMALAGGHFNNVVNAHKEFIELFVPKPIPYNRSIKDQLKIGKKVKEYYFGNEKVSNENIDKLIHYCGTEMFVYAIILWQRISSRKNTVYLYKFTCKSERNFLAHILGVAAHIGDRTVVSHADDIPYIFPVKMANQKIDPESKTFKLIENVVTLWTNFAKYGQPTPDDQLGVQWLPYTVEGEDYLDIGQELVLGRQPENEEFKFWESIFKEYLPELAE